MKAFLLYLLITCSFSPQAKIIQILHTNDLHSYQDHYSHKSEIGGYARLKAAIDKLKKEAQNNGIETLVLDGGDYLEGQMYYLAENGGRSFSLLNQIGHDVVVMGNHDYLMGIQGLEELFRRVPPQFSLLAANIKIPHNNPLIHQYLKPYETINIGGKKITIVGLTTSEIFYTWKFKPGIITDAISTYENLENDLIALKSDAIIALTHLGVRTDKKLASRSMAIDLVVGGHSHTFLENVNYQNNKFDESIPIVQAGEHGKKLGRLLVDIDRGKIKVIEYRLIALEQTPQDQMIAKYVRESYESLENQFGKTWLNSIIGHSELKSDSDHSDKQWTFFVADALREEAQADISIHVTSMVGNNFPVGNINRFNLYNAHPRTFEFEKPLGWNIYTAHVSGFLIKSVLKIVTAFDLPLALTGLTFDKNGKKISNIRVNGEKVSMFKTYKMALPEAIVLGANAISSLSNRVIKNAKRTPTQILSAIENKIKREGGVIRENYLEQYDLSLKNKKQRPITRQYYPGLDQ